MEDITLRIPGMVFFVWTGEDFDGCKRTIQWFRQALPAGPQIDLLWKEIPRYCKKQACKPGEIWAITLASTGFHFTDEYGEGKIVRPVGFTPVFQQNAGWDDNLTINPPRCILEVEKAAHSGLLPDDTSIVHVFSDGDFFRHFLGIQHTYLRVEEVTLGISFNAQSQAPDIPNISFLDAMIEYTLSLKATHNDPPRDSVYNSPFFRQPLQMLPTRIFTAPLQPLYIPTTCHIHPFLPQTVSQGHTHLPPSHIQKKPYQGFWRSEVHVLRLRIRFVRQDLASVHSFENLPAHEEVNGIQSAPSPRLPMTRNIHLFLKPCLKISRIYPPAACRKHPIRDFGAPRFMFYVYGFVRQDLTCVYSDGFGSCFLIWVCFFNDYRWSTIHTVLFVSFA
jgi:hypothetical protein